MRTLWILPCLLAACDTGEVTVDKDPLDTDSSDTDVNDSDTVPTGPNEPPTAPEIAISPANPTSAQKLRANFIFEATDPDGDTLSYRWAWLRNGAPIAELTTEEVAGSYTEKGETWEVRVRAFDGREEGPTASASTTIGNAPPKVVLAWQDPAPTTEVDLVVLPEISDPDGDVPTAVWSWTRNGNSTAFNTPTVPAASTASGEVWRVRVVATDNEGATTEEELEVTIANRPPVLADLRIEPNPAGPARNLRAEFTATDPDGDTLALTYAWTQNAAPAAVTTSVVSASLTNDGDVWQVTVTADDRKGGVVSGSASVSIANSAPVLSSVEITPDPPGDNDDLVALVVSSDADAETLTTTYTWFRNGVQFRPPSSSARVTAPSTAIGDVWEVSVTVADASVTVGPVLSAPVEIANRPPSTPSIVLDPSTPNVCEDLVCRVVAPSVDPDGTAVTTTIRWIKNGVTYTGTRTTTFRTNDTIPEADLVGGDQWTCEVSATSGGQSSGVASATGTVPSTGVIRDTFPIRARSQADVLLVVDDSCSMSEEQNLLASAADALVDELLATGVDFHIGVVTTDMVAATRAGRLVGDGVRKYATPTTPNVTTSVDTMIRVGTGGDADERGLDALRAALSTPLSTGANAGFLRGTGGLGLLVLSDEDDFSTAAVSSFTSFALGLRASPDDVVTRAIVGPRPNGCTSVATGSATAGARYLAFVEATGGSFASICNGATAFQLALGEFAGAVSGLPRRFPLSTYPDDPPTVVAIAANGTRTTLAEGSAWVYEATANQVVLVQRPTAGSTLEISYVAGCATTQPGPGDTDGDSGLQWPTGLPLPARAGLLSDTALPMVDETGGPPASTVSLWGPTSFP